ncbi:Protein CLP1 -like protein [Toxocara canis]|uniref:Protein CLP1-like protein n=1 Tax=Toxocara canis TaxID=6265 RepID=A0A0B2V563_TOXCA|nr:Protein CLP1 -like protein [Toxocara canis]
MQAQLQTQTDTDTHRKPQTGRHKDVRTPTHTYTPAHRQKYRQKQYFYGTRSHPLYPHSFEVKFDEVTICKIGGERLPPECLPYGMKVEDHRTKVVRMEPSSALIHHLVSVSPCSVLDQTVLTTNILGFLVITAVDMEKKQFTVLSPQPYPLPSKILILSEVTFVDDKVRA